jgi:hypothetical protein
LDLLVQDYRAGGGTTTHPTYYQTFTLVRKFGIKSEGREVFDTIAPAGLLIWAILPMWNFRGRHVRIKATSSADA